MRKTLATIVLALGLAVGGIPAIAAADDGKPAPSPVCLDEKGNPVDCSSNPVCYDAKGVIPCYDELLAMYLRAIDRVASQAATIAAQQETIARKTARIQHLRHRLHNR